MLLQPPLQHSARIRFAKSSVESENEIIKVIKSRIRLGVGLPKYGLNTHAPPQYTWFKLSRISRLRAMRSMESGGEYPRTGSIESGFIRVPNREKPADRTKALRMSSGACQLRSVTNVFAPSPLLLLPLPSLLYLRGRKTDSIG